MNNAKEQLKVHLIVRNRDKILFDEDIKAITSINDKGIFDILPEHANFMSLIQKYILIHKLDGTKQRMDINNGVLKIRGSLINCYVDILPPQLAVSQSTATVNTVNAAKP